MDCSDCVKAIGQSGVLVLTFPAIGGIAYSYLAGERQGIFLLLPLIFQEECWNHRDTTALTLCGLWGPELESIPSHKNPLPIEPALQHLFCITETKSHESQASLKLLL